MLVARFAYQKRTVTIERLSLFESLVRVDKLDLNLPEMSQSIDLALIRSQNELREILIILDFLAKTNINIEKDRYSIHMTLKKIMRDKFESYDAYTVDRFNLKMITNLYNGVRKNGLHEDIFSKEDLSTLSKILGYRLNYTCGFDHSDESTDNFVDCFQLIEDNDLPPIHLEYVFSFQLVFAKLKEKMPGKNWSIVREKLGVPFEKLFMEAYEVFGEFLTEDIFNQYKRLDNSDVSDEFRFLGVSHVGPRGKAELKRGLSKFREKLLIGDIDDNLQKSELQKSLLKKMTRFEDAFYGHHDAFNFDRLLGTYFIERSKINPLNDAYTPSEAITVDKAGKKNNFQYTEAFLIRYNQLIGSLKVARDLYKEKKEDGLQDIMDRLGKRIIEAQAELQRKMELPDSEVIAEIESRGQSIKPESLKSRRINLQKNIESLQSVLADKDAGPQLKFNQLCKLKGVFDAELRELMFFFGYFYNQKALNYNIDEIDVNEPKVEQISWALDFVDHIVNQETLSKYFTDKSAAKNFSDLLSVASIQEEMFRLNGGKGEGGMPFKFVPTRNLLTELSGHMAEACWASKYSSILKSFPNFVSLIMIQNPGKAEERFCGASLLIETTSADGSPLLVIRGLNPLENVITQLDAEDFFKKVTKYLRPIADKMGRRLAVVIDDASGGACTNRPTLFSYIKSQESLLPKVTLASAEGTSFNNHNIVNNCYLL